MNGKADGAPIAALTESNFEAEVLPSEQPVVVAFWAPWSRPCQAFEPVLQELASALAGKAKVGKVNADESLGLSLLYDIQSIPTLLCFVEGRPRFRIVGTATKQAILARLKHFGTTNETIAAPAEHSGAPCQPGKEN